MRALRIIWKRTRTLGAGPRFRCRGGASRRRRRRRRRHGRRLPGAVRPFLPSFSGHNRAPPVHIPLFNKPVNETADSRLQNWCQRIVDESYRHRHALAGASDRLAGECALKTIRKLETMHD